MRIPRPSLPRRRPKDKEEASALARIAPEDDARLLRRTRLRLMAVSGAVTLVLLVLLGAAVYTATANVYKNDSIGRLQRYADAHVPDTARGSGTLDPEQFGTPYSGILLLAVLPNGRITTNLADLKYLPRGLPAQAGIDAAAKNGTDTREVTISQDVQLRVFTESAPLPDGSTYFIQAVIDRGPEINLLNLLRTVLLAGGGLAFLAALAAGYLYAGRALVPIRASIDRREAALQRQREFTANGSHELRTPLTVIRASVEDLRRNSRSRVADVGDALDDMDAEVRHLTALVEDMLLLARTDSGVVQVECMPVDLADVALEATSTLSALGGERGVGVVADPLPAPVIGDPLRLRQLVTILVDNAIRHSPSGSTVTVRVRSANGGAYLWVEDQGHGIKPEDLPRLFERFWRADNAPVGGTGLGLSIARWIVEQHGGTIGAENRPEGGARFWAQIPSLKPNAKVAPDSEADANSEAAANPEAAQPPAWTPGDQDQPIL